MKVYIVCNDIPERVFKKKKDAREWLLKHGYKYRKGFYQLTKEMDTEFDLIIVDSVVQ